jgi:type I restriction enzyme M protein
LKKINKGSEEMLGAIIGDIVGSRFEWNNIKTKEFELLTYRCFPTDDSIMSLAVAQSILNCNGSYDSLSAEAIKSMQRVGRPYPDCGYGGSFRRGMFSDNPKPYGSYGNGAAMRVRHVVSLQPALKKLKICLTSHCGYA